MDINIEELRTWITALRSGKFDQTKGTLQDLNGYCCLGVACRVLIPEDKLLLTKTGLLIGSMPFEQQFAPEWLKDINTFFIMSHQVSLISLNDFKRKNFTEIADLLEKTFLNDTVINS